MKSVCVSLFALSVLAAPVAVADAPPPLSVNSKPTTLELRRGGAVEGIEVTIEVPENRSNAESRPIAVRFIRFPAVTDTGRSPIVYLAGGPGGSGTGAARGRRWAMFDALRQTADVIILDQRGTGRSDKPPRCESSVGFDAKSIGNRATYVAKAREAFLACEAFWIEQGVDLKGYTTLESAADIDAVRQALGVKKLSLLGISYGSHLALATMKTYPDAIDRVVLVSSEGLEQTVKLPARTDAYFERVQAVIDADPKAKEMYPDVAGLVRSVVEKFKAEPQTITGRRRDGSTFERQFGGFMIQLMTGYMISDPARLQQHLFGLKILAGGSNTYLADWAPLMPDTIGLNAMSTVMDLASGISLDRAALVTAQARTSLLADALNFPMPHLDDVNDAYDLGDDFRINPRSDLPVLMFSGTLDGRTYPEAAQEVAANLSNGTLVTVENAGHNLFFAHPDIVPMIKSFFAGEKPKTERLVAPAPKFGG